MKKVISLLFIMVMALSLCACGAKSSSSANNGSEEIEFSNVILVDNDKVKIELVKFYSEQVNWGDRAPANEKYIVVKATNKTDHEFVMNAEQFYINGEEMHVVTCLGSINPAPGKTSMYSFIIDYKTTPQPTALKSLDELYLLEGKFSGVEKFDENMMNNRTIEVSFSIPDALNK